VLRNTSPSFPERGHEDLGKCGPCRSVTIPEGRYGPHTVATDDADVTSVGVAEGYRLWAPSYAEETAVSHLENLLVQAVTPPLAGCTLLDAGCGTGRRLRDCGAAEAVGVDLSPAMLDADSMRGVRMMLGDVRALPLPDRAFDVVWCRLVIGHVPECAAVYAELARVAKPGATIVVTDFHPAAHTAGHRRSFRHGGRVLAVEHHLHTFADHVAAAGQAGLTLTEAQEVEIGPEVRHFYERAGKAALYETHVGLPVVLGLVFAREC